MKKFFAMILTAAMVLTLIACSSGTSSGGNAQPSTSTPPAASDQQQTQPAQPAEQEQTGGAPTFDTDWPKKTIQLVCPYAAGGDTDYYTRTTAKYLEKVLGTTVVVVDTSGASGTTGALSVLDQDADGYSFLFGHQSVLFNQATGSVPFDYLVDFIAVGSPMVDQTYSLYCHVGAPYSTLAELADYCKAHPGEVSTIAATGGSSGMSAVLMEKALGDIEFKLVEGPSSSAEKLAGFLGGQYDLLTGNFAQYRDYVADGSIICLGNYGSADVPVLTEKGIQSWKTQGYDYSEDYMFMVRAKAGTDQAILDKMAWALSEICNDPDFRAEVELYNATVGFQDGDACTAYEKQYFDKAVAFLAQ